MGGGGGGGRERDRSVSRERELKNLSVRSVFKVLRLDRSKGKAGQSVRNGLERIIMGKTSKHKRQVD